MPLTRAQIEVLRFATVYSVYETDGKTLHAFFPYRGAPAHKLIAKLQKSRWLGTDGRTTEAGRGALLNSPEASSEAING
jgi:hypothetical protein